MSTSQVCILMLIAMIFIPFICSLIEEIVKEYISKNKFIKKQNMELKREYIEMVKVEQYRIYKKLNKMQFQNCVIK